MNILQAIEDTRQIVLGHKGQQPAMKAISNLNALKLACQTLLGQSTGIPEGVTVRKGGVPLPADKPRNLLHNAALQNDVAVASMLVRGAMGITDASLALIHLPEQKDWKRMLPCTRLIKLAEWLRAEAYEQMDFIQVADPLDTVGTRD